ncbi:hypothetical protein EVAR_100159_1 [Eumeta japonica]|uniref:Uncharacterized protein n=1 Tax=Eumeta variegata TaxID=151549 RepID=A0A4C1ZNP2_EUMVA|nr:hypothetical protein EVAR_100159_1 [Eumeta japonica]
MNCYRSPNRIIVPSMVDKRGRVSQIIRNFGLEKASPAPGNQKVQIKETKSQRNFQLEMVVRGPKIFINIDLDTADASELAMTEREFDEYLLTSPKVV